MQHQVNRDGCTCQFNPCKDMCDPPTSRQLDQSVGRYNNESAENLIAQRQAFIRAQEASAMTMLQNQQAFTMRMFGVASFDIGITSQGGG